MIRRSRFAVARAALLALAALIVAIPAAAQVSQRPRPVLVAVPFLLDVLDPARSTAGWQLMSHGIGETLFNTDPDGKTTPGLAESARREGETWIVKLREGRKFSDGAAVNAPRVADALMRSARANPLVTTNTGALQIDVIDPLTLRITPTQPVPRIEPIFAGFPTVIYKNDNRERPIFTGPYMIADFRINSLLRLEPNPHHPLGKMRAAILIRRVVDAKARIQALESGDIDLAYNLPGDSLERLRKVPDVEIRSAAVGFQYMIIANLQRLPLTIPNVRKALDFAIDRNAIVKELGHGEPAAGLFPASFRLGDAKARAFDPARASRMLDQVGVRRGADGFRVYSGKRVNLEILAYPQRPDLVAIAPIVKAQLAAIGIDSRVRIVENAMQVVQSGDFDLALWAMHPMPAGDAAYVYSQYLRDGAPRNYGRYESPRFEGMLENIMKAFDPVKRAELIGKAQTIILEDVPMMFLMTPQIRVGITKRLAEDHVIGTDAFLLEGDLGLGP